MIDTHCHLNDAQFADDAVEVLARAETAGVTACLVAGFDAASSARALELSDDPMVWIALGIHPHDASSTLDDPDWLLKLKEALTWSPRAAAVGEMGLDFHYNYSPKDVQTDVFRRQLALAQELGLPVTI